MLDEWRRKNVMATDIEDSVNIKLLNLSGTRLSGDKDQSQPEFEVNIRIEEIEKRTGLATFDFKVTINSKPGVVKFDANGIVYIRGKSDFIEKVLQPEPDTKVPPLMYKIYQQVYLPVYVLSGFINSPYPPPDLVFPAIKSEVVEATGKEIDKS